MLKTSKIFEIFKIFLFHNIFEIVVQLEAFFSKYFPHLLVITVDILKKRKHFEKKTPKCYGWTGVFKGNWVARLRGRVLGVETCAQANTSGVILWELKW